MPPPPPPPPPPPAHAWTGSRAPSAASAPAASRRPSRCCVETSRWRRRPSVFPPLVPSAQPRRNGLTWMAGSPPLGHLEGTGPQESRDERPVSTAGRSGVGRAWPLAVGRAHPPSLRCRNRRAAWPLPFLATEPGATATRAPGTAPRCRAWRALRSLEAYLPVECRS